MKEDLDPNKKTILVVDDEKPIIDILVYNLKKEGYNTLEATDGEMGFNIAVEQRPDLILLDVMLPKMDGLTVCKRVKQTYNVPILMISAKDEEIDKIVGLELGADDYITKPFKARELLARINATLRRYGNNNSNIIKIQDITIDLKQAKVFKNNKDMMFTALEYKIFLTFALNQNTVITREKILADIWDINSDYVNDNTLTVYIKRIREKIEDDPTNPKILKTVRGIGYVVGE